jgi:predicted SAM-dependent methyltransferase
MKLNLGCGNKHLEGFINCDMPDAWHDKEPDRVVNLRKPLPFGDETADEIVAFHSFEHFYRFEADAILEDWVRVLKPDGLLVLEVPCLDKIIGIFNACIAKGVPPPENLTLGGLYGDLSQRSEAMAHRWCYSVGELTGMMQANGLEVEMKPTQTHIAARDMRLEGRKLML